MNLRRFRVQKFRSIDDSGWIEGDRVTTLVGINEAGKSNLLLALWKLNPAKDGEIDLLSDLPRELYSTLRDAKDKPIFIQAEFVLDDDLIRRLVEMTGTEPDDVRVSLVERKYDGNYYVSFPEVKAKTSISTDEVRGVLQQALADLEPLDEAGKGEAGLKEKVKIALEEGIALLTDAPMGKGELDRIIAYSSQLSSPLKTSSIKPLIRRINAELAELQKTLERPNPGTIKEARQLVLGELPSFVYYSNYGNLDSEIYLPHVIDNLKRNDLTGTIAAKTRTLRVLFDFVGLDPQEILEKGKEPEGQRDQYGRVIQPPSQAEIDKAAEAKRERDVLLHSASVRLTKAFRDWWKQGAYTFDLAADGYHFRIWVSDAERPAKVELENRSTGLQWFLSFFLVFLVESEDSHEGAIILLDEAGLSLHPLAQKDLSAFFENLAETNQLIHTTHSPFLVNTDHIDRVKVVYVDDRGYTAASSDLRAGEKDPRQSKSVYAVHAALGLSVSEALLQGCHPVIVEGQSDQYYLSAMKVFLISQGQFTPEREIVFAPAGGVRGITGVAGILAAKDDELPLVLLDSDQSGQDYKKKLLSGLYQGLEARVIAVGDVLKLPSAEVEDLIPFKLMRPAIDRLFRNVDDEAFEDVYDEGAAIVPQLENFAQRHGVILESGWKVDLARQVKGRLLQQGARAIDDSAIEQWKSLFVKLYPPAVNG